MMSLTLRVLMMLISIGFVSTCTLQTIKEKVVNKVASRYCKSGNGKSFCAAITIFSSF